MTYYITSYVPGDTIDLRDTWQTIINICSDFTKYANYVGFPGGSVIKNSPAKQETRVQSLGQEYPLKKEMATHSSILV